MTVVTSSIKEKHYICGMRQFQIIVQFFAVLILLIHSIIPHRHHAELSDAEHQKEHIEASSLFDFLALSFHFDHPEGQLEDFTSAQSDVSDVDQLDQLADFSGPIMATAFPEFAEEDNHVYSYQSANGQFSASSHSLRGPPSLL